MENFSKASKRKKRRTRKCLDEIRNRSRNVFLKPSINGQNAKTESKNKNIITLNRLTLAMFPKAIRSETITRPILTEKKLKPSLNESVNNLKVSNAINSGSIREPDIVIGNNDDACINYAMQNINDTLNNQTGTDHASNYKENDSEKENCSGCCRNVMDDSSGSMFCSITQTIEPDKLSNNALTRTSLTTPSQSSHEDYGYHILYEELMAEIPVYLKNNTSPLVNEDVIKKTQMLLRTLYIESCHQECEDNMIECMTSKVSSNTTPYTTHREIIVQNPMDYIRLEYERCRSTPHGYTLSVSDSSSSPLDPHSPFEPLVPMQTTAGQETPEYSYYPHKLNQ